MVYGQSSWKWSAHFGYVAAACSAVTILLHAEGQWSELLVVHHLARVPTPHAEGKGPIGENSGLAAEGKLDCLA